MSTPFHLNAPIVGIATTADGKGYWLAAADGGVFAFGDAKFFGSMVGKELRAPIVSIAATTDGNGYWLVGADGGVFTFGDAAFRGSLSGTTLAAPVVAIVPTWWGLTGLTNPPHADSYWLVEANGNTYAYNLPGVAPLAGTIPSPVIAATSGNVVVLGPTFLSFYVLLADGAVYETGWTDDPIFVTPEIVTNANPTEALAAAGIAKTPEGNGYTWDSADGSVINYGSPFFGSMAGRPANAPMVGIAGTPNGNGYWLVGADGGVYAFGHARFYGSIPGLQSG